MKIPRLLLTLGFILLFSFFARSQKPAIDTSALGTWPHIYTTLISDDGNYSSYVVEVPNQLDTLFIVSNIANWGTSITGHFQNIEFSPDSRSLYFLNDQDSLCRISLGTASHSSIAKVRSFHLTLIGKQQWLSYLTSNSTLVVKSLTTNADRQWNRVKMYQLGPSQGLVISQYNDKTNQTQLQFINLNNWADKTLWSGLDISQITFSPSGNKLLFTTIDSIGNKRVRSIYYYTLKKTELVALLSDTSQALPSGYSIAANQLSLSRSETVVLISLDSIPPVNTRPKIPYPNVDIWGYNDKLIVSNQGPVYYRNPDQSTIILALSLATKKLASLTRPKEVINTSQPFEHFLLLSSEITATSFYQPDRRPSLYLVSTSDGSRKKLVDKKRIDFARISPDEQFVVWVDPQTQSYMSYEIASGKTVNLSALVPVSLYDTYDDSIGKKGVTLGVAAWSAERPSIFLYDQFDIWKVDLRGIEKPVNILKSYGRNNHIAFGLVNLDIPVLKTTDSLLLTGFNIDDKTNGFWFTHTLKPQYPQKATMGPYAYCIMRNGEQGNLTPSTPLPVKATHTKAYLVRRMTASQFPNVYFTTNFSTFTQLSHLAPQSNYNWLTAELLTWKMFDGRLSQGILYKPENFDPNKKYPLIFDYYEKRSDQLNGYIDPEYTGSRINIPHFVSNGYLIFVPDIYYTQGHNGQGVVNSVVSAAQYLSSHYNWIDPSKMGLQGHSHGGWETNFLITHSHCFAAACAVASVADEISIYDQNDGDYYHYYYEVDGQGSPYGVGVTPWTRKDLYVENSPIFFLDSITTPLLLAHGDVDHNVPFTQALEMYLGMRRARKKVWLLQYEHASHGLRGVDAKDFTIRMKQFFDYYLKNTLPPLWMTRGIKVKDKQYDAGLDLNYSGTTP